MAVEIVVDVEGLKPEDRERFIKGFENSFYSSKLEFNPPHHFEIRLATDAEKQALDDVVEKITWFVVFMCGPTDCFPRAAFVDEKKAIEWGIANQQHCDGYLIKKMSGVEVAELTFD